MRLCPYCFKEIPSVAKKCRYCGSYTKRFDRIIYSWIIPFLTGCLVSLVSFHYGQSSFEEKHRNWLRSFLKYEFGENYRRLKKIHDYANQDIGKIQNYGKWDGTPMIIPFPKLVFGAWNTVQYNDGSYLREEDKLILQKYYTQLEEIDRFVEDRKDTVIRCKTEGDDSQLIYTKDKNIDTLITNAEPTIDEVGNLLY